MPVAHLASRFWDRNADVVTATLAILLALAAVWVLRKAFDRHARRLAESVMRGELSPETDTRLRLIERLVYALVILLGIAIALSQFDGVRSIGEKVLASGAIAAAIVGFAARQTLANVVAGVMLAITQPLRVGDWILFDDDYGMVEDISLNFVFLRTAADRRVIIPNERIASGVMRNDTLKTPLVGWEVSLWIPPEADEARAAAVLADEAGAPASIAEVTPWGTRVSVGGDPVSPAQKAAVESELRGRCAARLRAEGLLRQAGEKGPGAN
jgi:small-conductance mechanosensitive channel